MTEEMSTLERKAYALKDAGDYPGALALRLRLEQMQSQSDESPTVRALNLNYIAYLGVHTGNLIEAEAAARRCLEFYKPIEKADNERLATYLMMLASVLAEARKFEEAVIYGEQALKAFAYNHKDNDRFLQDTRKRVERMRNKGAGPYLDKS